MFAAELVRVGLWETTQTGGYYIHDYPIFNFTAEEVREMQFQRSEAGKKSAEVRSRNKKLTSRSTMCLTSRSTKVATQRCSDPDPDPDPNPDPDPKNGGHPQTPGPAAEAAPATRAEKAAQVGTDAKALLDYHAAAFLQQPWNERHDRYAVSGAKDMETCKRLIRTYGLKRAKELDDALFASADPWIQKAGYTLGILWSQASKLVVEGGADNRLSPAGAAAVKVIGNWLNKENQKAKVADADK